MVLAMPGYMLLLRDGRNSFSIHYGHNIGYAVGTGMVLAGVLCLAALALTPRLPWQGRLLQATAATAIVATGGMLVASIWGPWELGHGLERGLYLSFILSGGGLFTLWASACRRQIKPPNPLSTLDTRLHLRCPRCSTDQSLPAGESHCHACGLWLKIEMEEPACPACGYNLHLLTHPQCPECGRHLPPAFPLRRS